MEMANASKVRPFFENGPILKRNTFLDSSCAQLEHKKKKNQKILIIADFRAI